MGNDGSVQSPATQQKDSSAIVAMNSDPDIRIGALALAEFSDPRRALITDAALNPDEIRRLSQAVEAHSGEALELSLRRMLAYFGNSQDALRFAEAVQSEMTAIRAKDPERHSLSARVMLGHGRMTIRDGRPSGDWTYRLNGMLSRVPAHGIAALEGFVETLPQTDPKPAPTELAPGVYLIQEIASENVETQLASPLQNESGVFTSITLRLHGQPRVLRSSDCPVLIGRDSKCLVQLKSETASRIHGRIEYGQGRFHYVDDSRNGTFVLTGSGEEVKLWHDRIALVGDGALSAGAPLAKQTGEIVRFSCHSSPLSMMGAAPEGDTIRLGR